MLFLIFIHSFTYVINYNMPNFGTGKEKRKKHEKEKEQPLNEKIDGDRCHLTRSNGPDNEAGAISPNQEDDS